MSFLRHAEIYRSDIVCKSFESWGRGTASRWSAPGPAKGRDGRTAPCSSSAMSFRAGYSLAGCSPAEPASASPTALSMRWGMSAGNDLSANGNLSLVSVSQHRGAVQARISLPLRNFVPVPALPRGASMSIVAGVDFGTLSVRVSLFDSAKGKLGAGTGEYPLQNGDRLEFRCLCETSCLSPLCPEEHL